MYCPSDNTQAVEQSQFWGSHHWDAHRIGWAIAGGCSILTVIISAFSVISHCRNYTNRAEQRQIIRILYMPPIYAIISFFSYRFFRSYTYYSLVQVVYEAVTLSAFLLLLIEYVASTSIGHSTEGALSRKDKRTFPAPFCCWRFRPTKAYFMYALKWSVMQYVVVRPVLTIIGIICQHFNVLCESGSLNIHFAALYLDLIDFICISIALYGLILFYTLTKEELVGRRPLAKFLSIKLVVIFTFYQTFVFTLLENRVIHGTNFWTPTNIADGLNALAICIEMIFFSAFMIWSFSWTEYRVQPGEPHTSIWRPLWDSINLWDFAKEIGSEFAYFSSRIKHRSGPTKPSLGQAFNVEGYAPVGVESRGDDAYASYTMRTSNDDDIRLESYKPTTLDLSQRGSPEQYDEYKPGPPLVA